jgi:flagellar protein FliS
MRHDSAAGAYRASSFENAPPLKLVHLMYEGALRYLGEAQACDPKADPARFLERLQRAEHVVCELRLALDPSGAPALTAQLESLYLFVEAEIRRALLEQDVSTLPAARDVLTTLLEGWKSVGRRAEGA